MLVSVEPDSNQRPMDISLETPTVHRSPTEPSGR
ncbi:hypothetical protein TNIN_3961, partial [Trichonephila inaurata madagascariensis]